MMTNICQNKLPKQPKQWKLQRKIPKQTKLQTFEGLRYVC